MAVVVTLHALERTHVPQAVLPPALSVVFSISYLFSGQKYKGLAFQALYVLLLK